MTPQTTRITMKTTDFYNKNDIRQLLERFMDGQTSPEEEERLAAYMRRTDVPEEWSAYKEMFAYFDEGMPQGRYSGHAPRRHTRRATLWVSLAAAAAVGALVLTVLPKAATTLPAESPVAVVADADSTATRSYDAAADSTSGKNGGTDLRQRRSYYKYKYHPAPPKTYYAKAADAALPSADTANDSIAAAADRLVAEQLDIMEKQQRMMMLKAEADSRISESQVLMAASGDLEDTPETY